jgi:hypothetical protein
MTEIGTRNLVEYLLSGAVDKQVDPLPVPWFPGRNRLLGLASAAVLTLLMATARQQIEDHADVRIPAEAHHRGLIRHWARLHWALPPPTWRYPATQSAVTAAEANGVRLGMINPQAR